MYRYSVEERVFLVKSYWISGSIKNCQRKFVEKFCDRGRELLSKRCIQKLVGKLETTGTLLDQHGGGQQKMSEETVHEVADRLQASPLSLYRDYRKKLEYPKAHAKELQKKSWPACVPVYSCPRIERARS
jgi:transposase